MIVWGVWIAMSWAQSPSDLVLVTHADVSVQGPLSRRHVRQLFLGAQRYWKGSSQSVVRLWLPSDHPVTGRCLAEVLDMAPTRFAAWWRRRELAGQDLAPRRVAHPDALVRTVADTPGAVGCVPRDAIPEGLPVRTVRVETAPTPDR